MFPPQILIFIWVCTNILGGRDVKEDCGIGAEGKGTVVATTEQ